MAEKDSGQDGPSLELPSLGFKRRKRSATRAAEPTPAEPPAQEPVGPRDAPSVTPVLTGYPAAAVTGLVVGVLLVGLVWAALQGCESVRGTSSCGRPGFVVLIAILALLVIVGRVLLARFRVTDPGSTSLLGVGVVALVVLLLMTDQLFEWWSALVVPAVAAASFALAHWVTTAFDTSDGDQR
jgi:hypothetical protein